MDYTIIEETDYKTLEDVVNKAISVGYKPVGGVCLSYDESGYKYYVQAIIKE